MAKIAELFVGLKFKVEGQRDADRANASTHDLARIAGRAAMALTAVSAGFAVVARMAASAATQVNAFVQTTGLDGGAFQRMAFEAGQAGVATGDLAAQLKSLQQTRSEVLLGMKAAPTAWGMLGITPADKPEEMVRKARKRLLAMKDVGMARTWALQAGFSEQMFLYFRLSNEELAKLDDALALTDEHARSGWRLTAAWTAFTGTLKAAGTRIFVELQEPLTELLKVLTPLVAETAKFFVWLFKLPIVGPAVKYGLLTLAGAVVVLAGALGILAGLLKLAPVWSFLTGGALTSFVSAALPFLPIIALVVAALLGLAAIIQDVWMFFHDGESVLGDVLQLLRDIGDVFTKTGDKADAALQRVKNFFKGYQFSLSAFGGMPGPIGTAASALGATGSTLRWLDRGAKPTTAPVTVTQNNSPSVTVTAPAGSDERSLAELFVQTYRKEHDRAYRQLQGNFSGPAEERP